MRVSEPRAVLDAPVGAFLRRRHLTIADARSDVFDPIEVRLADVMLPKFKGADTAFVFRYRAGDAHLHTLRVRAGVGASEWLSYAVATDSTPSGEADPDAFTIRSITTPHNLEIGFGYADWKGVLDSIGDFRGAPTQISYSNSKASEVRTEKSQYADIVTTYSAFSTVGSGGRTCVRTGLSLRYARMSRVGMQSALVQVCAGGSGIDG